MSYKSLARLIQFISTLTAGIFLLPSSKPLPAPASPGERGRVDVNGSFCPRNCENLLGLEIMARHKCSGRLEEVLPVANVFQSVAVYMSAKVEAYESFREVEASKDIMTPYQREPRRGRYEFQEGKNPYTGEPPDCSSRRAPLPGRYYRRTGKTKCEAHEGVYKG
jgi:hypothetical protein